MKLYQIDTKGLQTFYVVASDPTSAENQVYSILNKADYGYSGARKIVTITLITEEVTLFGGQPKPCITMENRLLLPDSCKDLTKL